MRFRNRSALFALTVIVLAPLSARATSTATTMPAKIVYKTVGERTLELMTNVPADWKASDARPAIVFFFGGGWVSGSLEQFAPQAKHFAERGLVCFRADYRVRGRDKVNPDACEADALDAMAWVRTHSKTLGVDPNRIVAAGGSAGGHVAACTFYDPKAPDNAKPNAMVLYNPVVDLVDVRDSDRVISKVVATLDDDTVKRLSPDRHLVKDAPPTIVFCGTADGLYPQISGFVDKGKALGAPIESWYAPDETHGFFNRQPWLNKTTQAVDEFLQKIGYLAPPASTQPASPSH